MRKRLLEKRSAASQSSERKVKRMRVVVSIDGSDGSARAVAEALALGHQHEFLFVHVLEVNPPSILDPFHDKIDRVLNDQLHEKADEVEAQVRAQVSAAEKKQSSGDAGSVSFSVRFARREGDARTELCDVAKEEAADLLVMGTRGLGRLAEIALGSVSAYASHHAPCSVMIVREREGEGSGAAAAADDS
jgi:nucleotide-binding universal stress UspA family protein